MPRHALRHFFTRVLPIALPLSATGCCLNAPTFQEVVPLKDAAAPDAYTYQECVRACAGAHTGPAMSCGPGPVVDGGATVDCKTKGCVGGRRPREFLPSERAGLARLAELEAASVHAFHILRDELRSYGAPARLVSAAERSARDEIRHARVVGTLAGVQPRVPRPTERARSLAEIAIENMREGCVREAFGAAIARIEAHAAGDVRLRRVMESIFPDEERHAEVALAVASWVRPRLSRADRVRVDDERERALAELRTEVAGAPPLGRVVDALADALQWHSVRVDG
jgi:hypothetical protein